MGTVTQANLANVRDALGGTNPVSMSQYYRGGPRVPATRTVITRDPPSGEYYSLSGTVRYWRNYFGAGFSDVQGSAFGLGAGGPANATSLTAGGWTFFRGTLRVSNADGYPLNLHAVWRQQSSTTNINTGVPASGQISISQLVGAENP